MSRQAPRDIARPQGHATGRVTAVRSACTMAFMSGVVPPLMLNTNGLPKYSAGTYPTPGTGDILAWGLPPGDSDTGHVVFVANPPSENSDGTWSIDVIDSSVLKHSQDDRPGGTGVGQGTLTLQSRGGFWQVNFNVSDPSFHYFQPKYLSALRVTI